jgi:hypothetical protein
MCELARNSIVQSGWELKIKKQWLGIPPHPIANVGDDLETVQNTNVPPGRLAFRREVLAEEKRLMMLSTRRSRANTVESWISNDGSRPGSRNMNGVPGLRTGILGLFTAPEREGLENVEEGNEEGEVHDAVVDAKQAANGV